MSNGHLNFTTINIPIILIVLFTVIGCESSESKPNIIFVISDDQSYPHCSIYGTKWVRTPGFDRVAKEGLLSTTHTQPMQNVRPPDQLF